MRLSAAGVTWVVRFLLSSHSGAIDDILNAMTGGVTFVVMVSLYDKLRLDGTRRLASGLCNRSRPHALVHCGARDPVRD
jgi:hypothetical protein